MLTVIALETQLNRTEEIHADTIETTGINQQTSKQYAHQHTNHESKWGGRKCQNPTLGRKSNSTAITNVYLATILQQFTTYWYTLSTGLYFAKKSLTENLITNNITS